jgi:7-cyano-7-deazaguanine synthase
MTKPAVVLLSGGLDSATVAAIARRDRYAVHGLTFSYGQRHSAELDAADRVARQIGVVEHKTIAIDLRAFGGSALTDDLDVPTDRTVDDISDGIPVTYVPARNTIFLSFAMAWAEVLGSSDVFIGVNALDYSGYPDCRPEFIAAFQTMARIATKAGVEGTTELTIHAPLIDLTKAEIVELGASLGVDFSLTVSCYDASTDGQACGRCDACILRRKGFVEAGLVDPTRYRTEPGAA